MRKYFEAEALRLVHSGNDYFDLLVEIIDGSLETLHLQTYIFAADGTGLRVAEALKRASERGVKVYVLVDAFGSFPFSKDLQKELLAAGIHFRLFSPIFSSESIFLWRRLHHKIVVADKKRAMTGGINIADKYNTNSEGDPWLDYAVLIEGEICANLNELCRRFYYKKLKDKSPLPVPQPISNDEANPHLVRFSRNDWVRGYNEIHSTYVESINRSESSITIVASYFLPGKHLMRILSKAAARGVKIKVIMAGSSDLLSVRLAENYLYDFYIRNNIQLYEWKNSVMHGKAMVVDDTWATIGSYNLNLLSHYISIELNADMIDRDLVKEFVRHLDEITNTCCSFKEIKNIEKNKWLLKTFVMWIAYNLYRITMSLIMTRSKHRKRRKK